jgi:hypothetical protein
VRVSSSLSSSDATFADRLVRRYGLAASDDEYERTVLTSSAQAASESP